MLFKLGHTSIEIIGENLNTQMYILKLIDQHADCYAYFRFLKNNELKNRHTTLDGLYEKPLSYPMGYSININI